MNYNVQGLKFRTRQKKVSLVKEIIGLTFLAIIAAVTIYLILIEAHG